MIRKHVDKFAVLRETIDFGQVRARPVLDDITVVIPTLGRPILEESLERIALGSTWPSRIIVVDQSSSPMIADHVLRLSLFGLQAEWVPSSQRGRAAGVNRGMERVQTRFVAVTDDDCFVDTAWLENMTAHLRESPHSIVSGRVEAEGTEKVPVTVTSRIYRIQRRPSLKYDLMCGGNMGIAMDVIRRVGLLDEDPCLRTAEDCEYAYRALRAGIPIVYAPDVIVSHFGWRKEPERAAQLADYALSHAGFLGKYLRQGDLFIMLRLLIHLARSLRRWGRGTVTADSDLALNGRAYATELLPGIIAGWRSRKSQ